MSTPDIDSRLQFALSAAEEAGQLTLRYFRGAQFEIELKEDATPVTNADREAEQLLRKRIAATFPNDAIVGEEFTPQPGSSGFRWIVDPIDGTKSFIRGVPLYGTLVGVEQDDQSVIGVIMLPALDECLYAAAGQGAWHRRGSDSPRPAKVSSRARLQEGLFCTSDCLSFAQIGREQTLQQLQAASGLSRTWGDCFGYVLVATGRAEVMVDPIMSVWDAAALKPILEEAGGTFTDWQGRPSIRSGQGIGTNGKVLEEVLAITRQSPAK